MKKYRILVGCPTSDHKEYCLKEYAEAVKSLSYKNYDVLIVDNSKDEEYSRKIREEGLDVMRGEWHEEARKRIVESRNIIRERAIEEGYDYLLSLEQDVIPPKDIIERLLRHEKEVITGVYFTYKTRKGKTHLIPLLYRNADNPNKMIIIRNIDPPRLIRVDACGLGCILIAREVLEKIRFRYLKEYKAFDDFMFCRDAAEKNIKIFANTGIRCKHLIKGWNWNKIKI